MGDVSNGVSGLELVIGLGQAFIDGPFWGASTPASETLPLSLLRIFLQEIEEFLVGRLRRFLPLRANGCQGKFGLIRAGRCHADKIAVAQRRHSRHRLSI